MHARVVLGVGKVSCVQRCPQFRSVLVERFPSCIDQFPMMFYK